eukprot:TRINITY_DN105264_c0_g1_i1.p1 TRINITY_DN105264_c0_g1~~TRINITY_DN105264_c0_g1_i1.p1  ORF type:complete len:615 (+),score=41.76 TRINITY_DN105264_c0_g1_i1:86-1846(+)
MELVFKNEFTESINLKSKKKIRAKASELTIKCFVCSIERNLLFGGLSNGHIYMWQRKPFENKVELLFSKEYECVRVDSAVPHKSHKGPIYSILYETIEDQPLLITGSADRTIKMWDVAQYKGDSCVQTIVGHQGSVIALKYLKSHKVLISSSSDKTIRMWCLDSGRQLFRYPWFLILQVVKDFSSATLEKQIDAAIWITTIDVTEGTEAHVLAGDSEGSIILFKAGSTKMETVIDYSKTYSLVHKNGVKALLVVKSDNFIFTTSYDQFVKGFDLTSGTGFFMMKNPNKQAYTSLAWDKHNRELYVADGAGYIGIMNVYAEKPIFWEKVTSEPIRQIQISEDSNILLAQCDSGIHVFELKRGMKTKRLPAHNDIILKIVALDPFKLPEVKNKEKQQAKFVTVGMDWKIKLWNAAEFICIAESVSPKEVCSLAVMKKSQLIVTGCINGSMQLMNFDLETVSHFDLYFLIKTQQRQKIGPHRRSMCNGPSFRKEQGLPCDWKQRRNHHNMGIGGKRGKPSKALFDWRHKQHSKPVRRHEYGTDTKIIIKNRDLKYWQWRTILQTTLYLQEEATKISQYGTFIRDNSQAP